MAREAAAKLFETTTPTCNRAEKKDEKGRSPMEKPSFPSLRKNLASSSTTELNWADWHPLHTHSHTRKYIKYTHQPSSALSLTVWATALIFSWAEGMTSLLDGNGMWAGSSSRQSSVEYFVIGQWLHRGRLHSGIAVGLHEYPLSFLTSSQAERKKKRGMFTVIQPSKHTHIGWMRWTALCLNRDGNEPNEV